MTADGELWHIVEAKRDDGIPTMFRIRELDARTQLTKLFVIEIPYPTTELSRLPNAAAYRRLSLFEEQWLRPASSALGWELVAAKTEDGSFFLYLYGASEPDALIERISPFDGALGFFHDLDPQWDEYGALRELLDQAKAMPFSNGAPIEQLEQDLGAVPAMDLTMPTGLVAAPPRKTAKRKPKPSKAKVSKPIAVSKPKAVAKPKPVSRHRHSTSKKRQQQKRR